MKMEEINTRLKMELDQWFIKQCRNNFADFYLYYIEATPEHNGGFIICENDPPNKDYKLAWNQAINKGATVNQNYNLLRSRCVNRLPIIDD